ncbi:patched domain-containing protein 3-like [Babylonia areolata]|uniref:patched domain-containing protein 3-like n=1 Tax=Babylonia areolata TaxID=304850 RepID=UPI003FCFA4C1
MTVFDTCYTRVRETIGGVFRRYGILVGRHPVPFIIIPIVIFGGLGAGLAGLEPETDLESVYFPKDSQAIRDRQFVRDTFPDLNNVSYSAFSQSDSDNAVTFIFKTKGGQSIFDTAVTNEIASIKSAVESLSSSGQTFSDFCAKLSGSCVVDGKTALDAGFRSAVSGNIVTYPVWNNNYLDGFLSGETLSSRGVLVSATVHRLSFKLAEDATDWKKKFFEFAETLDPTTVEVAYETPESLSEELDKSTKGDIVFFSLTITLCCTYASLVTTGGNPVSTRSMLAFGGILATGLGIVGSMGLLSACGVKFVNIVGVIPFLIIGIGVDDMFLMMSSWSESLPSSPDEQNVQHVPEILGKTLAKAGIGITITSVTDFLAFMIGAASVFRSVTNFSLYAGVAVLFCYLANVTMFSGCLAIHGRRVYSWRHSISCLVTKTRQDLKDDGRSSCVALVCGGNPPREEGDDQSVCEKFPTKFLPYLVKKPVVSVVIIILFLGYLAASIYGAINLKQGLVLNDLVLDSSYYHKFLTVSDKYFPTRIPVGFVVKETVDYSGSDGTLFQDLLQLAQSDDGIDSSFERCWLTTYKSSGSYNAANFMTGLPAFFTNHPDFEADVLMDSAKTTILASRCFVYSVANNDQYNNANLMQRMRDLADGSALSVFAYHSSFVAFEQFLAVLPATMLLVGCAVAVMTVVTFVFLPHILMVLLVVLTIIMILVGIFGFMYYWDLTLSSITMIHLVMSVGFSVDFSAHVCTAYLLSHAASRKDRARDAICHAAGPILNGATSTMLGVLLLLASSSFIFQSFFKVMFLVISFGLLHAVFFLPAVLSLLGPENTAAVSAQDVRGELEEAAGCIPVVVSPTPQANGSAGSV